MDPDPIEEERWRVARLQAALSDRMMARQRLLDAELATKDPSLRRTGPEARASVSERYAEYRCAQARVGRLLRMEDRERPPIPQGALAPRPRPDVLVVDDEKLHRIYFMNTMQESAVPLGRVRIASSAREAIERVQSDRPDVVFLDMVMETPDAGIETLRAIRQGSPQTRVFVVSALGEKHPAIVEALAAGAAGYLGKPASREAIRKALRSVGRATAVRV